MSESTVLPTITILGLPFFNGTVEQAISRTLQGGLLVAPSGPGLAESDRQPVYYKALRQADIILVDSGLLAILWKQRTGQTISRISGLLYLKSLLSSPDIPPASQQLWVMPTEEESAINISYLRGRGINLTEENCYLAPFYPNGGEVRDAVLLKRIQAQKPSLVVLNVAGGKQEILGAWLKRNLDYNPAIICTGAAIAFLTGQQASIPDWVDRAKLGWLQRILFNPTRYFPRYLAARRLENLLRRYGVEAPLIEVSPQSADKRT
ncbi:MAG: WecB/TagA/CpsF family glycosyltransferase [Puniceicoccales bacterium]